MLPEKKTLQNKFEKNLQYYKFCAYGFLKNQRFFEPFLIIIFLNEKGLSFTQIGSLYSVRYVLRSLLEIPSGVIADSLGRRGTMLFSYTFYILSFIAYFFSNSFLWLLLPSVLYAVGDAFRTGTHKAMIFDYLLLKGWKDQKVNYYGHTRSWSQSGSAISSLLAATLILLSKNPNCIFLFALIPYSIGILLIASYPKYLEGSARKKYGKPELKKVFSDVLHTTLQSLKKKSNLKLMLNVSSFTGYVFAVKDYLQVLLSSMALSFSYYLIPAYSPKERETVLIGVVYFLLHFLTAAASRNTAKMNRLFTSTNKYLNVLMLTGLIAGIFGGIFYSCQMTPFSIILFCIILIIQNLRRPAGVSCIAGCFENSVLASVLSFESQLSSVFGAVLSLIIGVLADHLGVGYSLSILSVFLLLSYPVHKLKTNRK